MNRRDRLMAVLRGQAVDRPPVSFYELNGLDENIDDANPFNIYSDPSWRSLIELTREKTDRIVMRPAALAVPRSDVASEKSKQMVGVPTDPLESLTQKQTYYDELGRRFVRRTIDANGRKLTSLTRQDRDVNTIWMVEHLLKNIEDLKALLSLDIPAEKGAPDVGPVLEAEAALGDTGIVMLDTPDPLCLAALLFDMADYTVIAMTEPTMFHRLLEKFAAILHARTAAVAATLPGRLWRIYGPEFASPPYLPPRLFQDYVVRYDQPMIESIHSTGGYARVHSHGNLSEILADIVAMGADAIDPIEPPPQGDVTLSDVRQKYGRELTLFGNLEICDIENMPTDLFKQTVTRALDEGDSGSGRGFVLMPSACPYGRKLPQQTLCNYQTIIEILESRY